MDVMTFPMMVRLRSQTMSIGRYYVMHTLLKLIMNTNLMIQSLPRRGIRSMRMEHHHSMQQWHLVRVEDCLHHVISKRENLYMMGRKVMLSFPMPCHSDVSYMHYLQLTI